MKLKHSATLMGAFYLYCLFQLQSWDTAVVLGGGALCAAAALVLSVLPRTDEEISSTNDEFWGLVNYFRSLVGR